VLEKEKCRPILLMAMLELRQKHISVNCNVYIAKFYSCTLLYNKIFAFPWKRMGGVYDVKYYGEQLFGWVRRLWRPAKIRTDGRTEPDAKVVVPNTKGSERWMQNALTAVEIESSEGKKKRSSKIGSILFARVFTMRRRKGFFCYLISSYDEQYALRAS